MEESKQIRSEEKQGDKNGDNAKVFKKGYN
jgi:hypothetical protein